MKEQIHSPKEASRTIQPKRTNNRNIGFVDNRIQSTTQRKLIDTIQQKSSQNSDQAIQRVELAEGSIVCPHFGNAMGLGATIHGLIEGNYVNWPNAGAGNTRVCEFPVANGHIPDLELRDVGGNIIRYGEIKPLGSAAGGRTQISNVYNDNANVLTANDQVNCLAWANQVHIPVTDIDTGGNTLNATNTIEVSQDVGNFPGLYIYHGN